MMRIENLDRNETIENIGLRLTMSEAQELRDGLSDLLKSPRDNHVHVASEDFLVEVTVWIDKQQESSQANNATEKGPS